MFNLRTENSNFIFEAFISWLRFSGDIKQTFFDLEFLYTILYFIYKKLLREKLFIHKLYSMRVLSAQFLKGPNDSKLVFVFNSIRVVLHHNRERL